MKIELVNCSLSFIKSDPLLTANLVDKNNYYPTIAVKIKKKSGTNEPTGTGALQFMSAGSNYTSTWAIPVNGHDIIVSNYSKSPDGWSAFVVLDENLKGIREVWNSNKYEYQEGDAYVIISNVPTADFHANYGDELATEKPFDPSLIVGCRDWKTELFPEQ